MLFSAQPEHAPDISTRQKRTPFASVSVWVTVISPPGSLTLNCAPPQKMRTTSAKSLANWGVGVMREMVGFMAILRLFKESAEYRVQSTDDIVSAIWQLDNLHSVL